METLLRLASLPARFIRRRGWVFDTLCVILYPFALVGSLLGLMLLAGFINRLFK